MVAEQTLERPSKKHCLHLQQMEWCRMFLSLCASFFQNSVSQSPPLLPIIIRWLVACSLLLFFLHFCTSRNLEVPTIKDVLK